MSVLVFKYRNHGVNDIVKDFHDVLKTSTQYSCEFSISNAPTKDILKACYTLAGRYYVTLETTETKYIMIAKNKK